MREALVAHVVELIARHVAIALQGVEHVAVLAIEALIDRRRPGAERREIGFDQRARLVRPGVENLDRAGNVASVGSPPRGLCAVG